MEDKKPDLEAELKAALEIIEMVVKIVKLHGCSEPKDCGLHFLAEKLKIQL